MSTASSTEKIHQGIEAAATGRVTRITQKDNVTFLGLACNRNVRNDRAENGWEEKTTFTDVKLVGDAHKKTDFSQIKKGTLLKVEGPLDEKTFGEPGKEKKAIEITAFKPESVHVLGQPKGDASRARAGAAAAATSEEPPF